MMKTVKGDTLCFIPHKHDTITFDWMNEKYLKFRVTYVHSNFGVCDGFVVLGIESRQDALVIEGRNLCENCEKERRYQEMAGDNLKNRMPPPTGKV